MAQIESKRLMYQRAWAIHIVVLTAGQEKFPIMPAAATVLYSASENKFLHGRLGNDEQLFVQIGAPAPLHGAIHLPT